MATPRQIRRRGRFAFLTAVVVGALAVATGAFGYVSTDQADYSPGSVVTISGGNDASGAPGYWPGNGVHVDVSGPNGWTASCDAIVQLDTYSTWSCPVTLSSDPAIAVGSYSYTATSMDVAGNPISETGTFTDAPPQTQVTLDVSPGSPVAAGGTLTFSGQLQYQTPPTYSPLTGASYSVAITGPYTNNLNSDHTTASCTHGGGTPVGTPTTNSSTGNYPSSGTVTATAPSPASQTTYYYRADFAGSGSYNASFTCTAVTVNAVPSNANPNDPSSLEQYKSNGTTTISTGGLTNETSVVLKASVSDPDTGDTVKLQVEVKPVGTSFDGTTGLWTESALGANPHTGAVTVTGLSDGSYHWRARTVDNSGATSDWVSYGDNAESAADFVVDTTPPSVTAFALDSGSDSGSSNSDNITNASTLTYDITFSEDVSGVVAGDFGIGAASTATGCTPGNVTSSSGSSYTVDLTGCSQGTVVLTFAANGATDGAGNSGPTSAASATSVLIDRTAPTSAITFPADNTTYVPSVFAAGCATAANDVCGTASDTGGAGLDSVQVQIQRSSDNEYWDGTTWSTIATWIDAGSTSPWTYGFTPVLDETYTLRSTATDLAGNTQATAASATFTVAKAATSLLYTGDTTLIAPTTGHLSATLSSSVSVCRNLAISYTFDEAPGSGGTDYGPATGTISFAASNEGVYVVTANFAGSDDCLPSSDEATVTIGSAGSKATGGGFVTGLQYIGRVNFGFVVDLVPKTTSTYKGQFVLVEPNTWRFKGCFGQACGGLYAQAGTSGSGTGSGTLYHWDGSEWVVAANGSNLTFSISFTDNGSGAKGKNKKTTSPDQFGIHINYDAVANGYSDVLPNFPLTDLKGGNITVS